MEENKEKLTPFEEQFIDAWFRMNFNGRLAYKSLKPHVKNETADTEASKILSLPKVQHMVEMKQEEIRQQEEIKLSWMVQELKRIVWEVSEEELERDEKGRITAKPDRRSSLAAMQLLARLGGLDTKKIDITSGGEKISINFRDE